MSEITNDQPTSDTGDRDEDGNVTTSAEALFEQLKAARFESTDGSIPNRLGEELQDALAIIEQYTDPEGRISDAAPCATSVRDAAATYASLASIPVTRALGRVRDIWKGLVTDRDTRIGTVSIDVDAEPDPLAPMVCFVSLRTNMRAYEPGVTEAMAIAYFPTEAYARVNRTTGETTQSPSWYDDRGYSHIIRYFDDCDVARDEMVELARAVRTVRDAVDATAYDDDPVRAAIEQDVTTPRRSARVSPF